MAACALASARVRDGAVISSRRHQTQTAELLAIPAETFYAAAEEALPSDRLQMQPCDFDFLRACGLLAIASIQEGRIDAMQKYIGYYFTMMAVQQGHDEANWPPGLSRVEMEERRRLYWSIYTLDIYSSIVWDGCFHFQEAHARVEYPSGDVYSPNPHSLQDQSDPPWIIGWNFTTDLYRILEHFVGKLRTRGSTFNFLEDAQTNPSFHSEGIIRRVTERYAMLPNQFKDLREATEDPNVDIYGFQSANIHATMALLRMVLYTLEGQNRDIYKKCTVAHEVLSTFREVPLSFWRAISTPLIYHIASIGALLWSAMEGPLSDTSYQRVRTLLLEMAELLQSMEQFLNRGAGEGQRLREMVARIDEFFAKQLATHNGHHVVPSAGVLPVDNSDAQSQAGSQVGSGGAPVGGGNGQGGVDELSPQFQLPYELLQEWTWPSDISQAYLPGIYNYHPAYTGPYG
ncbi:hypothetical protein QBC46DRAFT_159454 [Diplogelasinospora grovesii]|uniref:Xylanolytic transcriptional activator regulatory domain-containing protein n=1 Tax=Diplogelasinospora grovesii TaxID=303347 RepID=A0AAN6N5L7_9PEZI|nr:hypothetical protein QBC46DRAFT_159454 [Diplogelasinospora grovesii]